MNKKICALLCLIILSTSIYADDSIYTTEDSLDYINQSLSIHTERTAAGAGALSIVFSGLLFGGYGKTGTLWTPYQGPKEIDKKEFLSICGQTDLVEDMNRHEAKSLRYRIAGYSLLLAGIATDLVVNSIYDTFADDPDQYYASWAYDTSIMLTGVFLTSGVLCVYKGTRPYDISIDFVIKLSDRYNRQLARDLK